MKTGTDSGASSIDLSSVSPTTISTLVALSAPQPIPPSTRVAPTETMVWTLNATLTGFKLESDSDYHLVLSDDAGNTMIVEIPSPNCVAASSPFASAIAQARARFDAAFTVSSSLQHVSVPVQVTGIGMFDFLHGQTGVAPNGIELHPVLKIDLGGLSLSASPSTVTLTPGGSGTLSVAVSASGNGGGTVSLSLSGTPSGVTASFAPSSVNAPGNSTLTLSAAPTTSAGNYTLTITGSGGGSTGSTAVALAITSSSSADFSLSATPAALPLAPGTPATTTITSSLIGSFASDVALSASGLPSGLTASFNPVSLPSPGNGSSLLTLAADSSVVGGNVNVQIAASGGGTTHGTTVAVNVCAAPPQAPALNSLRLAAPPVAPSADTDDDEGSIQIVPSQEALDEARQHGGEPICRPRQSDVFLGSGWTQAASRERRVVLAHVSATLRAPAICGTAAPPSAPLVHEDLDHVAGSLSDLQIQIRLQKMVDSHRLEVPSHNSIYVVFLAPEVHSRVSQREAGRGYLAYHNHFHGPKGEIRYVVVPFDSDARRQRRTIARAILNVLINPEGPVG